jgi:hypothetical protein
VTRANDLVHRIGGRPVFPDQDGVIVHADPRDDDQDLDDPTDNLDGR